MDTYTRCDGCHRIDCVNAPSAKVAAQVLTREGWLINDAGVLCPVCIQVGRDSWIPSLRPIRAAASPS